MTSFFAKLFGRDDDEPRVPVSPPPLHRGLRIYRQQIASEIAETSPNLTRKQVDEVLDRLFHPSPRRGVLAFHMDQGNRVSITRFGTFFVRHRPARRKRMPTGHVRIVPARDYPAWKPSDVMRNLIRRPGPEPEVGTQGPELDS